MGGRRPFLVDTSSIVRAGGDGLECLRPLPPSRIMVEPVRR
ncbi:hypothetical protein AvCA_34790 [Azotobacter vinelandii CA]|uniref:Uncharacterized protein n=2 Tax=Azotobacter vinelandii TaxID=354 RepID=C1DQJ2_AZOVD|nr:hypothetical protein Avin_34790 [Azotobacter vinelandii DJ]AGK16289.1 hypothetical protein AvCA_34790 [Azotobacter vinelandii CA]AGK21369.1 hypothetical protein AvCA6_34790 [Azotobacter vinelandii CA6]